MEQNEHQSDPLRPENLTARAFQLLRDEISRAQSCSLPASAEAVQGVRDLCAALDRAETICMKAAKRRSKTKAEFAAAVEAVMAAQRKPVSGTIYRVTKGGGR